MCLYAAVLQFLQGRLADRKEFEHAIPLQNMSADLAAVLRCWLGWFTCRLGRTFDFCGENCTVVAPHIRLYIDARRIHEDDDEKTRNHTEPAAPFHSLTSVAFPPREPSRTRDCKNVYVQQRLHVIEFWEFSKAILPWVVVVASFPLSAVKTPSTSKPRGGGGTWSKT